MRNYSKCKNNSHLSIQSLKPTAQRVGLVLFFVGYFLNLSSTVAADMEAERTKVASLEAFRSNLQTELTTTKTQELESRRTMLAAADELAALRSKYSSTVSDLELTISRKDRECRELKEEVEILRGELRRERELVITLKVYLLSYYTEHPY
jgi:predicted RNase H-like nuclease (RuvC/YqgF family)